MRRLRISAITAAYPAPSEPTRAVFLMNFFRELAAQGLDLDVVAPRIDPRDPGSAVEEGLAVHRFPYPSGGRRLREGKVPLSVLASYMVSGLHRHLEVLHRTPPDLVYAHWVLPAGVIGAVAASLTGVPLVLHAHGSDIHRYAISSWLAARVARLTLRRARLVMAVSRDLVRRMKLLLGPADQRFAVIPMGYDGRLFSPTDREATRRRLSLENGRLELLFVGDLEPWKGILPLARALLESPELARGVRLHVAGDGVLRGELEALQASGRGALVLHGRQSQEEVSRWCRAADLLVLPSAGEGTPLAVLEALASGLPVLSTPVGGVNDLVTDGENGWLAGANEFPARLLELLRQPHRLLAARKRTLALAEDRSARRRAHEAAALLREVAVP